MGMAKWPPLLNKHTALCWALCPTLLYADWPIVRELTYLQGEHAWKYVLSMRDVIRHTNQWLVNTSGGRCANSRIGPTWDNTKLRHFSRSWSPSADTTANKNEVI